jgi:hypothetical protein
LWRDSADRWGHDLKNHVSPVQLRPSAQKLFRGFLRLVVRAPTLETWRFLGIPRVGHGSLVTTIANHLPTRLADYVSDD